MRRPRCFLEKFTQLAQILNDRRSWQILTLKKNYFFRFEIEIKEKFLFGDRRNVNLFSATFPKAYICGIYVKYTLKSEKIYTSRVFLFQIISQS